MPLEIVRNDITKMSVDAIVNAANSRLEQGGGVFGAIFEAAGADKLRAECSRIGHCAVGEAAKIDVQKNQGKFLMGNRGNDWKDSFIDRIQ